MGNNPIPPAVKPTRESFHLGRARSAYIDGTIDLARFCECVDIVLDGGTLPQDLVKQQTPNMGKVTRG